MLTRYSSHRCKTHFLFIMALEPGKRLKKAPEKNKTHLPGSLAAGAITTRLKSVF
jgi:hypothetical protein